MNKLFARYQNWRFARANEAVAKIGAVFLAHPDRRVFASTIDATAGVGLWRLLTTLHSMRAEGFIAYRCDEDGRRYYALTDSGRMAFELSIELDQQRKDSDA
ncbi:hypothetical protein [Nocardia sp. NPDC049149]|uniref:hypothetical protein n=1 Tax=Nocardia sp. NPDC049149 TaxID=3364315 RepID=UPI00371310FC